MGEERTLIREFQLWEAKSRFWPKPQSSVFGLNRANPGTPKLGLPGGIPDPVWLPLPARSG